jgi:hypothetical protein
LVRVRAPLTTPSGLRILAPGTVTNAVGGTLISQSITPTIFSASQLQAPIPSPVHIATPETQSAVQPQPSTPATGQMSGIQALVAAAAATQKMSTGTTFPIMLHFVFLNGNIKGNPGKVK